MVYSFNLISLMIKENAAKEILYHVLQSPHIEIPHLLRENSLYTHENSPNPFHTLQFCTIPSIPFSFTVDPFSTPNVGFPSVYTLVCLQISMLPLRMDAGAVCVGYACVHSTCVL